MRRIYLLLPFLISSAAFAKCLLTDEGAKAYSNVEANSCGDGNSEVCIRAVAKPTATQPLSTVVDRMEGEVCTEYHACCTTKGDSFVSKIFMPCYAGNFDGGTVVCDNSYVPFRAVYEKESGAQIATCYLE